MDKFNPISISDINDLYEKRKQKYRAPNHTRRQVLSHARSNKFNSFKSVQWWNLLGGVGIAYGLLLMFNLMILQNPTPNDVTKFALVEVHTMHAELANNPTHKQLHYTQHIAALEEQRTTFATHHRKTAILTQFDDGWEMETCNQELVKVSHELIKSLTDLNLVDENIQPGDKVEIVFNKQGLIIDILQAETFPHC